MLRYSSKQQVHAADFWMLQHKTERKWQKYAPAFPSDGHVKITKHSILNCLRWAEPVDEKDEGGSCFSCELMSNLPVLSCTRWVLVSPPPRRGSSRSTLSSAWTGPDETPSSQSQPSLASLCPLQEGRNLQQQQVRRTGLRWPLAPLSTAGAKPSSIGERGGRKGGGTEW